jgi:hypothetical protein
MDAQVERNKQAHSRRNEAIARHPVALICWFFAIRPITILTSPAALPANADFLLRPPDRVLASDTGIGPNNIPPVK